MAKKPNVKILLDASALIAVMMGESGAEAVERHLDSGVSITSVNLAETISKLMQYGFSAEELEEVIVESQIQVVPFEKAHALLMPIFQPYIKSHNLSLADRVCLSVAQKNGYIVLTTDTTLAKLALDINVRLIR